MNIESVLDHPNFRSANSAIVSWLTAEGVDPLDARIIAVNAVSAAVSELGVDSPALQSKSEAIAYEKMLSCE